MKTQIAGPTPGVSDSEGRGWGNMKTLILKGMCTLVLIAALLTAAETGKQAVSFRG